MLPVVAIFVLGPEVNLGHSEGKSISLSSIKGHNQFLSGNMGYFAI